METPDKRQILEETTDFLYEESELLSDREYENWLTMLADDISYKMLIVRNLSARSGRPDYLEGELDLCWFDEGKDTIGKRVQQIATGQHWAEAPPSRTTRMLSNIRIHDIKHNDDDLEVLVRYNFVINRNRNEVNEDSLFGKKIDVLVKREKWQIKSRKVYINQPVILLGNLSFFI